MENQMPNSTPVVTPPTMVEQPKKSNFLIILLSVLLIISVVISGFFAFQTQRLVAELKVMDEKLKQAPIAEASDESFTIDPVTGWKIYKDIKYNYSISYPQDWVLDTEDLERSILKISSGDGELSIDPTNQDKVSLPIKNWVESSNQQLRNDLDRHSASSEMYIVEYDNELEIKEIPIVIDASFFGRIGKSYLFDHNNSIFYITAVYYDDEYGSSIESDKISIDKRPKLINQILSTFKFTN